MTPRFPDFPIAKRVAAAALLSFAGTFAVCPPTAYAQLILNKDHTIETLKGDVIDLDELESYKKGEYALTIKGAGTVQLDVASNKFYGPVFIHGAEFRFYEKARMRNAKDFTVTHGGEFVLDNSRKANVNQISNKSSVLLNAGTLRYLGKTGDGSNTETFGGLSLEGGANTIDIVHRPDESNYTRLRGKSLTHGNSTATLNLTANVPYTKREDARVGFKSGSQYAIEGIIPWATVAGDHWVTTEKVGSYDHFVPFGHYDIGTEAAWTSKSNVNLSSRTSTLTANHTLNSLRFGGATPVLNLNRYRLTIASGGLLSTGGNARINGAGAVTSGTSGLLYAHIYGDKLTLEDQAALQSSELTKTGPGALVLDSDVTHHLNQVTINEGVIRLLKGWISVVKTIVVGDGAGTDALELGPNLLNPIVGTGSVPPLPSIKLAGNPHKPTTDSAILRFGGDTRQQLATLQIHDRGVLDFGTASTPASPNILYLDHLLFTISHSASAPAQLTIRNWIDHADYLLVKKAWGDTNVPPLLPQIIFEGYGPARWHWHNLTGFDDYWQITPLPEPSTYGAILGTVGLGLALYRRRRRAQVPPSGRAAA